MTPRSGGLTREGLEHVARELGGMHLDPGELEALLHRLGSLREALRALDALVEPSLEPLSTVTLEDFE